MPANNRSLLALSVAVLALGGASALAQGTSPRWHSDLHRAAELSRGSGKPLFVVFRCVR